MRHQPVCVPLSPHGPPSNPYKVPPWSTVLAECPMQTRWTAAPPPHYPEALPLTLSDKQLHKGSVSVDATVASTMPSRPSDPMLATTSNISQLWPGKTIVISNSPLTVNGEESAELASGHRDAVGITPEDQMHAFVQTPTLPGS